MCLVSWDAPTKAYWCTWGVKVSLSGLIPQKSYLAQYAKKMNAGYNQHVSEHSVWHSAD